MGEGKQSFWDRIFNVAYCSDREEKVLECVIRRLGDEAQLGDIARERYVRGHAFTDEAEDILDNPRLVEAAQKNMEEDSEELGRVSRARGCHG
jgi:hypothetical protein